MIRTSTYATQKYALNDTYLISPVTNIAGHSNNAAPSTHVISDTIPHTANHVVTQLNGSNNVKLTVWMNAIPSGGGIRITGWNRTVDKKFVPSLLYYGLITSPIGTVSSTILSDVLYPVTTFPAQTAGYPATGVDSNQLYHSFLGGTASPGSLILNTMGCTHIEYEFWATAAGTGKYNIYVTEF